jgi:hypothetical protein
MLVFKNLSRRWVTLSLVALLLPFSQSALAQPCDGGSTGTPTCCDGSCPKTPICDDVCPVVCAPNAAGRYSGGGGGTSSYPYLIGTPQDLVTLSKNPIDWTKYFCQYRDIDMAFCLPITPIGLLRRPFTGCYAGAGYRIRNLEVVSHSLNEPNGTGMFGVIGSDTKEGIVVGVFLENPTVIGSTQDVGALVGRLVRGRVACCASTVGRVFNGAELDQTSTGGLIGQTCLDATVRESFSTTLVSGGDYIGGLVGQNGGLIEFCYAENKVIQSGKWPAPAQNVCLGGLVGFNNAGAIRGSYAYGIQLFSYDNPPIGVKKFVGGLVGQWVLPSGIPFVLFPYNFSRHCTPGLDAGKTNNAVGGPDPATNLWVDSIAKSRKDCAMVKRSTYEGWDFESIWFIVEGSDTPKLRWF